MIDTIYIEDQIRDHPRAQSLLQRFANARVVRVAHYGEVFNRHGQNFRLQKTKPALILAQKNGRRVMPVPNGYGLDAGSGYYFSHMLNCLYDCRYCFLQGMFQSAHYLLFVNYDDFIEDIRTLCSSNQQQNWFFSGYDCDSLALEPISQFAEYFVPKLAEIDNAWLELRTKSTQVRHLLNIEPPPTVVCAFSLSPQIVIDAHEAKTPSLAARLNAMQRLQAQGWLVAVRFDPLLLIDEFATVYDEFFRHVLDALDLNTLHSITYGSFRLPASHFRRMHQLHPEEALFSSVEKNQDNVFTYPAGDDVAMLQWCERQLQQLAGDVPIYRQSAE